MPARELRAPPEPAVLRMPDFCAPRRGVRQTIDAAIPALERLGVEADRIVLRSAGGGWIAGTVVAQEPAPGTELGSQTRIVLSIAGSGALESLPFALREESDEEMRADAIFALFDNPILKLRHTVRSGGGFLAVRPDQPATSLRWIEGIFRLSPEPWPKRRWYALARLLPVLHRIAGRAEAIPLALRLVFGLPVANVRIVSGLVPVPASARTRLATANGRLGVDATIGVGLRATTAVLVEIGAVTLDTYREHGDPFERAQREAVYKLVLPAHLHGAVRERWTVGSPDDPPRLHDDWQPAALGLNSYLGGSTKRRSA
jgi:hypothetical protein